MKVLNKYVNLKKHFILIYIFSFFLILYLFMINLYAGLTSLVIYLILAVITVNAFKSMKENLQEHEKEMFTQIEKASNRINEHMPIGVIIYTEELIIEWVNSYIAKNYKNQTLINQPLQNIFDESLINDINSGKKEAWISSPPYFFKVWIDHGNNLMYFFNRTEEYEVKQKYEQEKIVLANIYLDNFDDVTGNMDDNVRSQINSEVTKTLNKWAEAHQFYIKRISQDRFLAVLNEAVLQKLEKSRFHILDEIRTILLDKVQGTPMTLSVGIGTGNVSILELAKLAQSSLDLVLGRGGDQVAIKGDTGKIRFFGGKTNPVEKRTRVRARVIAQSLIDLIKNSDQVFIMGHRSPDMDAIGSALGILNIIQSTDKQGYIIFDENDMTFDIEKVYERVKLDKEIWQDFIHPSKAKEMMTENTLIVVVDTHRPSLTIDESLILKANQKVVIDHHRRSEDFVDEPTLVYMEPYASSTAELVTELIEYTPNKKPLSVIEATVLLAGIIVDTQSFAFRTGSRTFDAASYLRKNGADPVLIQEFMKENLETYVRRNKLVELAYLHDDSIAIVKAPEEEEYNHIIIAQTADMLLSIENVIASFVIANTGKTEVSISARSLGDLNVQVIMEQLDGGGHLTNAATQLKNISIDEVESKLIDKLDQYFKEE